MFARKNALAETDGDLDKVSRGAADQGRYDVGKRAERATAEGLVAAATAPIELTARLTLLPRTREPKRWPTAVGAAAKPADVDALKGASIGDKTVEQAIAELSAKRSARSSSCVV